MDTPSTPTPAPEPQTETTVVTPAAPVATPAVSPVAPKKSYALTIAIALGVLAIIVAFLFTRGYLVAATVNGSPISRLAVIQELEKQGGAAALQSIIDKKLIAAGFADAGVVVTEEEIDAKLAEIETQVSAQGGTLEEALAGQGMTMDILRDQLSTQLGLEEVLSKHVTITDEEVTAVMKENNITAPEGMSADDLKAQITAQLKQQKFQTEAQTWIAEITDAATIKQYVTY